MRRKFKKKNDEIIFFEFIDQKLDGSRVRQRGREVEAASGCRKGERREQTEKAAENTSFKKMLMYHREVSEGS